MPSRQGAQAATLYSEWSNKREIATNKQRQLPASLSLSALASAAQARQATRSFTFFLWCCVGRAHWAVRAPESESGSGSVTVSRCCCCRLLRRVGWLVEFLDSVLLLLVLPLCCCCAVAPKQVSLCGVRCATWFLLLCVLCAAVNVDVAVADFSVRVASAGWMLVMIFVHVGCCCLWWFLLLLLLLLLLAASTTGDAIDCCVH